MNENDVHKEGLINCPTVTARQMPQTSSIRTLMPPMGNRHSRAVSYSDNQVAKGSAVP